MEQKFQSLWTEFDQSSININLCTSSVPQRSCVIIISARLFGFRGRSSFDYSLEQNESWFSKAFIARILYSSERAH